jgi:hypothetical protein
MPICVVRMVKRARNRLYYMLLRTSLQWEEGTGVFVLGKLSQTSSLGAKRHFELVEEAFLHTLQQAQDASCPRQQTQITYWIAIPIRKWPGNTRPLYLFNDILVESLKLESFARGSV